MQMNDETKTDSAAPRHMAPSPASTTDPSARARSVLIVDDENGVRDLMCRWLEAGGYSVSTASNAEEALHRLAAAPSAVALCDIRMPGRDGLWLAERIRRRHPETAVIMATGVQDVGAAVESMRQGAVDYLTKPFGRDRLREAVLRGLEWHRSAWDARRWRESLEQELDVRRTRLRDAIGGLRIVSDDTLDAMLSMLTLTDRDAYAHAYRVAALTVTVARAMGVPESEIPAIEQGALLHDVGKLTMPDAILRKPAPLTMEEQALVRQHPAIGSDLIGAVPYLAAAVPIVRDAHERMDGLGYPRGVRAEQVALGARIIAVADAYDTMIRPRVFRDALAGSDALLELARCRGTQFDPAVVDVFTRVVEGL
jgi:response regulator RpfG family c-di-GMP phosphodiesterase